MNSSNTKCFSSSSCCLFATSGQPCCVSNLSSVGALINNGYEVHVVKDACGSRAETEYSAGLERMCDNGAHIITTEIALFEWLGSAKYPKFKEVQPLIK